MSAYPTCPECGGSTRAMLGDASLQCRVCEALIETDEAGSIIRVTPSPGLDPTADAAG